MEVRFTDLNKLRGGGWKGVKGKEEAKKWKSNRDRQGEQQAERWGREGMYRELEKGNKREQQVERDEIDEIDGDGELEREREQDRATG